METNELKLLLLRKVMDTKNPKVLRTIGDILDIHAKSGASESGQEDLPATLNNPGNSQLDQDTRELQESIDEIFGHQSDQEW